jgi:hypothetical protein
MKPIGATAAFLKSSREHGRLGWLDLLSSQTKSLSNLDYQSNG